MDYVHKTKKNEVEVLGNYILYVVNKIIGNHNCETVYNDPIKHVL
mgnify:CR=1 FL=1